MIYSEKINLKSLSLRLGHTLYLLSLLGCEISNQNVTYSATIRVGEGNIVLIDEEPFFPIGIFHVWIYGSNSFVARDYDSFDEIFYDIKDGKFNTIHTYASDYQDLRYVDFFLKATEYDFKIISPSGNQTDNFSTLVQNVSKYMMEPALLSWYLDDEPDLRGKSSTKVKGYHDIVKEVDPYHLTSVVIGDPENYETYINVSDVFMIDSYPINSRMDYKVTYVSDFVDSAFNAMRKANVYKPLWVVLQAFGYQDEDNKGWGWDREPTYDEQKCMTYLAITHGANGIFYYCFGSPGMPGSGSSSYFIPNSPQHWQDLKSITRELDQLTPVLVSPDVAIENLDVNSPEIHFLLKDFQGRKYLFAVNSENQEVTGTFSGFYDEAEQPESDTLTVLFEDREVFISEGAFSDQFDSYGVHIYAQKH